MEPVHRPDDHELCGFVEERIDGWHSLVVFGASLGVHLTRSAAQEHVLGNGLAALMERWVLTGHAEDGQQVVCIQEANPDTVTVALDHYSLPGVPTLRIERGELDVGRWVLRPA